jgi:hypothetical protein
MQYCGDCKIRISSKTDRCPLCHNTLPHTNQGGTADYPAFEPIKTGNRKLVKRISIIVCALIVLSVLANWLTWNGSLWCVLSSACVLYAWGAGLLTFSKRIHLGWKLTAHAIALPLLLIVFNTFAYNTETIHEITWAISYGMPMIFICFIIAINIIMIRWRQKLRDYLLYQLTLCVVGFVPIILVLSGITQPMWPSIIAAVGSYCTIAGLVIYAKKIIKSEFVKKFHI